MSSEYRGENIDKKHKYASLLNFTKTYQLWLNMYTVDYTLKCICVAQGRWRKRWIIFALRGTSIYQLSNRVVLLHVVTCLVEIKVTAGRGILINHARLQIKYIDSVLSIFLYVYIGKIWTKSRPILGVNTLINI